MLVCTKKHEMLCLHLGQWEMFHKVHLSNYGFLAGSTDSLSNSLDSKSVEVWLQASKHVVQFVGWFRGTCGGDFSLGLDLIERKKEPERLQHIQIYKGSEKIILISVRFKRGDSAFSAKTSASKSSSWQHWWPELTSQSWPKEDSTRSSPGNIFLVVPEL